MCAHPAICSPSSLALIFIVIAESFTNATGCDRSALKSWATTIAAGPSKVLKSAQVVAILVFMSVLGSWARIVFLAAVVLRSLSHLPQKKRSPASVSRPQRIETGLMRCDSDLISHNLPQRSAGLVHIAA